MTDKVQASEVDAPEVVQTEAEQVEAPEAAKSTEGQVETPPAEGETPEQPEEAPEPEEISASKARRERRKAEMGRLRDEAKTLEAENETLREQLAEYERRESDPAPREDQFEDYAEYQAALSAHKAMQALDAREKARVQGEADRKGKEIEALQRAQQQEAAQNWAAQVADAKGRYADFDAVVSAPDLPIPQSVAQMLVNTDKGADVAYFLGTNRDQAAQIARMNPIEQAMAIGRIEATINVPSPRTQSKAPDPITPVKPKATASKSWEDMTPAEFEKWRDNGGTFNL